MGEVRAALSEFAKHRNLLGLVVAQYNPDKDPDGSGAKTLVDLLVESLSTRLETPAPPGAEPAPATSEVSSSESTVPASE
jgi:hypothetical protein